ncbi:hypothetical protein EMQ25_07900 [Arsenicitalea aurantiaca]|uniref:Transglycosylase SLT domain-containing protein n=1 Tax=Arsenicitalea aurantiaca TaxID=1783274 RepID=A0A433XGG2_9HYPH|nr:transglycosylase SLT domain-containing protein [Arsenicitalea aurantiaca]RUT33038.1 hypothetical protein EMQ25_07900 [Arsenicitalea aurantiaca]
MGVQSISIPPALVQVLNNAGQKSGVDFDYLVQTAIRESSLNPKAKAQTSTATGLFQFLESTWLEVMKTEGPRLGYQRYADAIEVRGGQYSISDRGLRAEVLKLREDPQIAADLAAAFTRNNGAYLQQKFGRMPSPGELYIAHFMGARGAEEMFAAGLRNPDQIAADLFPRQAAANKPIFYADGKPRTIREVYRALVARHDAPSGASPAFVAQQMASQPGVPTGQGEALPSRFSREDMSFTSLFITEPAKAEPVIEPSAAEGALFSRIYGQ